MSAKKQPRLTFQQREKKILSAATKIFSKYGFNGTKTKMIATTAGINEALLFRHFSNKLKLYKSVLDYILQMKNKRVLQNIEIALKIKDPQSALLETAKIIWKENKSNPQLIRILYFSGLENPSLAQGFYNKDFPLINSLNNAFNNWNMKLHHTSTPVAEYSILFLSMIHQIIVKRIILKSKIYSSIPIDEELKLITNVFYKGALT